MKDTYYYRYINSLIKSSTNSNSKKLKLGGTKPRLPNSGKYDFIAGVDLVEYIEDYVVFLKKIRKITRPESKIILVSVNSLWKPIIYVAQKIRLTSIKLSEGWISLNQLEDIAAITDYQVIEKGYRMLFPKYIPFFSNFINGMTKNTPLLKRLGLIQYIILSPQTELKAKPYTCSIIVPCFNEQDNIEDCIKNCPKLGKTTELIIVNDGSTDQTLEIAKDLAKKYRFVKIISYLPNHGKAYAVEKGFNAAKGDIMMIWDADRTVPEKELQLFYEILAKNQAGFANGTRLVYQMEDQAMKWLNLIGNKLFSLIFGWVLNTPISDTLCGTKALFKKDYKKIKMGNEPWGDFDLLFGAAKLHLKIREVPVHYRKRVAGESKMKVFKHGFLLAKMAGMGVLRLKLGFD